MISEIIDTLNGIKKVMPHKIIDLIGKKFGRLGVIGREPNGPRGQIMWKCFCECGGIKIVMSGNLRNGRTRRTFLNGQRSMLSIMDIS